MSGALLAYVEPARRDIRNDSRKRKAMTLYPGVFQVGEIRLESHWLKSAPTPGLTHNVGQLLLLPVHQLAENAIGTVGAADIARNDPDTKSWAGRCQYPAFPINDVTPRRLEAKGADRVSCGATRQVGSFHDLELEEPQNKNRECGKHDDRDEPDSQFARCLFRPGQSSITQCPVDHGTLPAVSM
jgi:hypothetical protein